MRTHPDCRATGAGDFVAYAGRWPGEDVPEGEGKYKLPPKFLHRLEEGSATLCLSKVFGQPSACTRSACP
jgi:hypothetical protein